MKKYTEMVLLLGGILLVFAVSAGCSDDLGIDGRIYACESDGDCGAGYHCVQGSQGGTCVSEGEDLLSSDSDVEDSMQDGELGEEDIDLLQDLDVNDLQEVGDGEVLDFDGEIDSDGDTLADQDAADFEMGCQESLLRYGGPCGVDGVAQEQCQGGQWVELYCVELTEDINLNPRPSNPVVVADIGDLAILKAELPGTGIELWRSDGTEEGSYLLKDLLPGEGSSAPHSFVKLGEVLYFLANDGVHGEELWQTDGTREGTSMVEDFFAAAEDPGFAKVVAYGDSIWGVLDGGGAKPLHLYQLSDGAFESYYDEADVLDLFVGEEKLFLNLDHASQGRELGVMGTVGSPVLFDITSGSEGTDPVFLASWKNYLLFYNRGGEENILYAFNETTDQYNSLNTSDSQAQASFTIRGLLDEGIFLSYPTSSSEKLIILQENGVPELESYFPALGRGDQFVQVNDSIFYVSDNILYELDGILDDQPRARTDIDIGNIQHELFALGGYLYLSALNQSGGSGNYELYRIDGDIVELVFEITEGGEGGRPNQFYAVGERLYFQARVGSLKNAELCSYQGSGSCVELAPGTQDASPSALFVHNGDLFFQASADSSQGSELYLWQSNAAKSLLSLTVAPLGYAMVGSVLYFANHLDSGYLWSSNYTDVGTERVVNMSPSSSLLSLAGALYFCASTSSVVDTELYQYREGPVIVSDFAAGPQSCAGPVAVGDDLFVGVGLGLYSMDSTLGTPEVEEVRSFDVAPEQLTPFANTLCFTAGTEAHGVELWCLGSSETDPLDIMTAGQSSNPTQLVVAGDKLFFTMTGVAGMHSLYVLENDLKTYREVRSWLAGNPPLRLRAYGDQVLFSANDGEHGYELWISDGSAAGTYMVADINPGPEGSYPNGFVSFGGESYFAAQHPDYGVELWRTDGSEAGTVLAADLLLGPGSSSPAHLESLEPEYSTLVFSALSNDYGRELMRLNLAAE